MRCCLCLVAALPALLPVPLAAEAAPARKLRPVPFTSVRLEDAFWAPRLEINRRKTVDHNLSTCERTGRIANFARAGKLQEGKFEGIYFNDSDVYKMLEGASYTLALERDPVLEGRLDEVIAKIAAAQWEDGYLNTYYTLAEPGKRWTDLAAKHELYCAGHLLEAAVAHFRATGRRNLLDVARRYADHIDRTFGLGKKRGVCGHEEIELALVKLYEVTGEPRYLKLSEYFINDRGNKERGDLFGEYCQDHLPVRAQSEIVGHAVRAMYLYSGAADIAAYTGDQGLIAAMERVWRNVVEKKMYVTGGIGPSAHNEGFTVDYDLPNLTAYAETCAAIGMVLWNHRLLLLHGDGRFGDVLEQVLYNGLLAGVSLDGEKFFYVNPLSSRGNHHRQAWYDCACCPTNIVRFIPSLGGYLYAVSPGTLWVNLYAASTATVSLAADEKGERVKVVQETRYPWSGDVKITLSPRTEAELKINLRIPGWCARPRARINGVPVEGGVPGEEGAPERGYLSIGRKWRGEDVIELELPMNIERLESHPAVKGNLGRIALRRGPLIYCLEAVDHGGRVLDVVLPRGQELRAEHRPELLGGVTVLKGQGERAKWSDWKDKLYRAVGEVETIEITAVPYYAWDNRAAGEMVVWMPESTGLALPATAPYQGQAAASHLWRNDSVEAVHDGIVPQGSGDGSVPRFTWWPRQGSLEWIEYSFPEPVEASGLEVYWFDDSATGGGCRVPGSWRILHRDGEEWRPVEDASRLGVEKDRFNAVTFRAVKTRGIRLEVQLQPEASAGILEWRLSGTPSGKSKAEAKL